jgi:voltage-gated potassium channel
MAMPETSRHDVPSFWQRSSIRRILQGIAGVLMVIGLGVSGYVAVGWDFFDALYMVVITITTVGYGEVRPVTTTAVRIHTMLVTVLGTVSVAYLVAGFVQFLAEGEIRTLLGHQRMRRQIEQLSDHAIVAGFGRVGTLVADDLLAADIPLLVIERSAERIAELERRGILYVQGDATEEDVLREAGLERAKVLVTTISSDAEAVFITLTVRQMAPGVMIVARAEQPTTLKKLRQAGANHVVVPAAIGARRIVSLLTNPSAVEFVELVTSRSSLAIEMDDIPISTDSPLKGRSLRDSDIGRRTGVIVIAVKRADGRVEFPPSGDEPFALGDSIVVVGRRSNLDQLRRELEV